LRDLNAITALEFAEFGELAYPYFVVRQLFDLHGSGWLVVEVDGHVVGYIMVALAHDGCAWILGFAVDAGSRGHGHGKHLLERALALCREAAIDRVFITVRPTNAPAYHLYQKSGFVCVGHEDTYFGAGQPRDVLLCTLELERDGE
jgi:ribosomal-protein-alanine N-acetyltransferase